MSQLSPSFLQALTGALGQDAVLTGNAIPDHCHTDWSRISPLAPQALLRPTDTSQVAAALRLCHAHRVPVVPQGGLTGLTGGAVPSPGAVALSLARMNRIEAVDPVGRTITVQAGATLQAVQEAAHAAGCIFGVDLAARGSCQIGGNLSTNAGGNGVVQFGMMREQALGLEAVLADGSVLDMMRPLYKNNTGYDLKHWFIGAEGTLGIITRAILRLQPAPRARATALAAVPDCNSALALLGRLQARAPGGVAAFELMWRDFLNLALACIHAPAPFGNEYPLVVLTDLTGTDEAELQVVLEDVLGEAMAEGLALDAVLAQSQAQAASLWRIREATAELPPEMALINFDISLPRAELGDFADRCIEALARRWPGHRSLRFGHLGDGNLHLSTDANSLGGMSFEQAQHEVESIVYGLVARAGGSISAEHGVGLHKKPYLGASRSPAEMTAMRAIKHALDPLGLLNPGKVFDLA
ncbi:MAG: FAD-binding oxidoreductase [Pigmentiphaga sp.]|uniref:FAD-binding oxidoreductase n=1 Tax=Pigmentiphaga sp. TaxID=1977564 RepID=UPI0029B221FA|nr:FAD-binding oxidoreductase [Pigmentiphaga sp.]MDX3905524.1 FAD-binding oxidoreductase [Pigmentiphaga sp.]